ncbi:hypothetical protein B0A50_00831 [Salinomyces thailandicus]|uniref:BTB domain-containing protein n=1 Tax=Salinomyces thailandicus TaxID=706561 RepID=A0A4U0UCT7_9PEZI|nr:hypothetical protein B0A50_00831 [Salinomyces thailandica]
MSGFQAQRNLKRHHAVLDGDEDDEASNHTTAKRSIPISQMTSPGTHREQDITSSGQPQTPSQKRLVVPNMARRLVVFNVSIPRSGKIKFLLDENAAREVPAYARQLDSAPRKPAVGERAAVHEDRIRSEATLIHLVEYLSYGTIKAVNSSNRWTHASSLHRLVSLYDLAILLELERLQADIVNHIRAHGTMNPTTFVAFAQYAYKGGEDGFNIQESCLLGVFIKEHLRDNLASFVETDVADKVAKVGGVLGKQLLEAFKDDYLASKNLEGVRMGSEEQPEKVERRA